MANVRNSAAFDTRQSPAKNVGLDLSQNTEHSFGRESSMTKGMGYDARI